MLTYAGWMLAAGSLGAQKLFHADSNSSNYTVLAYNAGLTWLLSVLLHSRLPVLAVEARWYPLRAGGWAGVLGAIGLWLGAVVHWRETFGVWLLGGPPDPNLFVYLRAASGIGLAIAIFSVSMPKTATTPFFLTDRTHVASREVRRGLIIGGIHALVAALAIALAASLSVDGTKPIDYPETLARFGAAYIAGILLASRQKYPQRQIGLTAWSAILATIALFSVWCAPRSAWSVAMLGLALGLGHLPPRSVVLSSSPPDQRTLALAMFAGAQILGAALGGLVVYTVGGWSASLQIGLFCALMLGLAVASVWILRRELFEVTMDMTIGLNYPIRAYGPGVLQMPTRGPALVIANHHAMLDPLWLSKIVPMKVTALMTSKFFDLPVIRFLVTKVVNAIRVPDVSFRREAPEIEDAVAGIQRGELVMIFPEGWLRRREEIPIRRFGQGAFQILKAAPNTPLIACWIEGGWGSYTSYKNGPPGKGKKFDIRRKITIGVCAPEVLPAELLDDQHAVRNYLLQKVVEARSFLHLPPIPIPSYSPQEEEKEAEEPK